MGIYIKGVDMPSEGSVLSIDIFPDGSVSDHWTCRIKGARANAVPPHGDLIDRFKILHPEGDPMNGPMAVTACKIMEQPTVIPESKETPADG